MSHYIAPIQSGPMWHGQLSFREYLALKQAYRTFRTLRARSLSRPLERKRIANIIRSLRKSFTRPGWMEPSNVPRLIYAMAETVTPCAHLIPPTRLS